MHNTDRPPPFHKVIIESGATTARAVYTPTNPMHEQQFQEFLTELGFQDVPEPYIMDELRTLDVKKIKEASDTIFDIYNPSIRWPFQPVIDGEGGMIPIPPIDAWRSGKWHKVPILTGFNTNEGAMFVPKTISTASQFTAFLHRLLPSLSKDDLEILNDVYPDPLSHPDSKYVETRKGVGLGAQFKRLEQAYGHFAYVAPVRQTARFAAADGDAPVYLYHFAVNSSVIGGADHGNHAPFVTYNRDIRERSDSIEEISGLMHAYWTSFITTYGISLFTPFLLPRYNPPPLTTHRVNLVDKKKEKRKAPTNIRMQQRRPECYRGQISRPATMACIYPRRREADRVRGRQRRIRRRAEQRNGRADHGRYVGARRVSVLVGKDGVIRIMK